MTTSAFTTMPRLSPRRILMALAALALSLVGLVSVGPLPRAGALASAAIDTSGIRSPKDR